MSAEIERNLRRIIDPIENDSLAIIEYAGLLVVLTAGPDAETAIDGIHRLMFEIRDHAENIKKQWEELGRLAGQIAKGATP
jgi:hypothetical protein